MMERTRESEQVSDEEDSASSHVRGKVRDLRANFPRFQALQNLRK